MKEARAMFSFILHCHGSVLLFCFLFFYNVSLLFGEIKIPPRFSYREGYYVAQFVLYILYEYHLFICFGFFYL